MRSALEPGEHEKQNVLTVFENLAEAVPIDERGHTGKVPDRLGHVDAAHKWGVLYMDALQQVRRKDLYGDRTAEPPLTTLPPQTTIARPEQQSAYVRGYTLWYLCGRPATAEPHVDARNHLWQYTVTVDNPDGSKKFANSPSGIADIKSRALEAFEFHTRSLDAQRMAAAVAAAASSAESSRAAGKRPAAAEQSPRVSTPKLNSPAEGVEHKTMYEAMGGNRTKKTKGFLQEPTKHHTFPTEPFAPIATAVKETLRAGAVIGWVASKADPSKGVPGALKTGDGGEMQLMGQDIYTRLLAHKIDDVYHQAEGGELRLKPDEQWPSEFKALGLQLVDSGTYNAVWRFGGGDGEALKAALSPKLAKPLIQNTHLLRMPKPDSRRTDEDVATELANVCQAHMGLYGARVFAAWRGRFEETAPGDGSAEARYKMFMIVERGTKSTLARIDELNNADKRNKTVNAKAWGHYLFKLRSCIWCFSANRCVHLDSKPGNFIDTFGDITSIENKEGSLRVIDLDGRYYDRIEGLRPEEVDPERGIDERSAMGWNPCWVYNMLYMSCTLRTLLDYAVYNTYWWSPIKAAMQHTLMRGMGAHAHDPEYQRARRFLMSDSALWQGYFFMMRSPKAPRPGPKSPEDLAQVAVNMAKFYFHDSWWQVAKQRLVPAARAMMMSFYEYDHAKQQGRPPEVIAELESTWNGQKHTCADVWTWFDAQFRPRGLPQIRFFETEISNDVSAKALVQAMYMFAQATDMDLFPYTEGAQHPDRNKSTDMMTLPTYKAKDAAVHAKWRYKVPRAYHYEWVRNPNWAVDDQAMEALGFGDKSRMGS